MQPAYVLHSRPYRDSSQLVDIFTAEYGRITVVARGSRRSSRKGSSGSMLQAFIPLLVSFSGRGEMKTLTARESSGQPIVLRGERLFSGLYLNELLVRLLHRHEAHPPLFAAYGESLRTLACASSVDTALRQFELLLLREMGYGFDLATDGFNGDPICPEHWYHFQADYGLVRRTAPQVSSQPDFSGEDLLSIAAGNFEGSARLCAKRLLRVALAQQLGSQVLNSRALFRSKR